MAPGDDDASLSSGESSDSAEDWEQGGDGYNVEYSLWMLKFLCPKEGCGGTLAPPTTTAVVMEARPLLLSHLLDGLTRIMRFAHAVQLLRLRALGRGIFRSA